jgi:hypothetical protein
MKNGTRKEKQFDVIAKSIILCSLDVGVFNRVFTCENAHELWKTIKEQNEGSKECIRIDSTKFLHCICNARELTRRA